MITHVMETAPATAAEAPPPSSPVAEVGDNFQEVDGSGTPAARSDVPEHDDNNGGDGEESDVESGFGGGRSRKDDGSAGCRDEEEQYWSVAFWNHGGLGVDQCLEEYQGWVEGAGFGSGVLVPHGADDQEVNKLETSVKDTREQEEEGRAFWAACLASCYPSP